jgi:hypothetical protein
VTYSFDSWKEGQVAPTVFEILIRNDVPISPFRERFRLLAGLLVPAMLGWWEADEVPIAGVALFALLMACGTALAALRLRHDRSHRIPSTVLGALAINALYLLVFAAEISAGVAGESRLALRGLVYFLTGLLLFWGLVTGRGWARHIMRWGSLLFALLFIGAAALLCLFQPLDPYGPHWSWLACGSYTLATLFILHSHVLARPSAKCFFFTSLFATAPPVAKV